VLNVNGCIHRLLQALLPEHKHSLLVGFQTISADYEQHRADIVAKLAGILDDVWAKAKPVSCTT
jgi:hypothetical protein